MKDKNSHIISRGQPDLLFKHPKYIKSKVVLTDPATSKLSHNFPVSVPANMSNTPPRRYKRSYTDLGYDWFFFRTTGQAVDKYKILHTAAANYKHANGQKKPARRRMFADPENFRFLPPHLAEEQRIGEAVTIETFLHSVGLNPEHYISELIKTYFFRNYVFYAYVWFNFYCSEYLYINLSLHFPIVDWLFSSVLFSWPVTLDFYFIRLFASIYLPIFLVFIFFQIRAGTANKFDLFMGFSNFFVFFGSIWLYYLTGISFFFTFFFVSFLFLFLFLFLYMVPKRLLSENFSPPLLLADPSVFRAKVIFLPKYSYRFPFRSNGALTVRQNFTKFPFLSNQLRETRNHVQLVSQVLNYSRFSVQFTMPIRTKEPIFGSDFDSFYGYNPYAYVSFWYYYNTYPVWYPFFYNDEDEDEDPFEGLKKFMDLPLGVSNTVFFAKNYRKSIVSLYKRHFTSDYDSHDFFFSPVMPLWQQNLLKDPYFKLYTWLKFVGPGARYAKLVSRSMFRAYCTKIINIPYPAFNLFLKIFYNFIERALDFFTFCRYYKLPSLNYPFDFYYELQFYTICPTRYFCQINFLKSISKFLLIFESRFTTFNRAFSLYEKLAFMALLSRLHSILSYVLISNGNDLLPRGYLFLRVAIRVSNRVLISLASSFSRDLRPLRLITYAYLVYKHSSINC
jgi:hypothetical protein